MRKFASVTTAIGNPACVIWQRVVMSRDVVIDWLHPRDPPYTALFDIKGRAELRLPSCFR
jgi:hypothetical protein